MREINLKKSGGRRREGVERARQATIRASTAVCHRGVSVWFGLWIDGRTAVTLAEGRRLHLSLCVIGCSNKQLLQSPQSACRLTNPQWVHPPSGNRQNGSCSEHAWHSVSESQRAHIHFFLKGVSDVTVNKSVSPAAAFVCGVCGGGAIAAVPNQFLNLPLYPPSSSSSVHSSLPSFSVSVESVSHSFITAFP